MTGMTYKLFRIIMSLNGPDKKMYVSNVSLPRRLEIKGVVSVVEV